MIKQVYVISLCVNIKNKSSIFHFKGVYCGHSIQSIVLNSTNFEKFHEYLMLVKVLKVEDKTLHGEVIYSKRLNL